MRGLRSRIGRSTSSSLATVAIVGGMISAGGAALSAGTAAGDDLVVAGYIARATLPGLGIELQAKLDTGADSSSINAPLLAHFNKDGKPWVRFQITGTLGKTVTIERPVRRRALIKRSGSAPNVRPVIRLTMCVAGVTAETDVTLANRKELKYQLLVGRKFLKGRLLIDSGRQMMHPTKCQRNAAAPARQ